MKRKFFTIAVVAMFGVAAVLTSCGSSETEATDSTKVVEDLTKIGNDAVKTVDTVKVATDTTAVTK